MINALLDISGKIDEDSTAALAHVKAAADSLGISFFIIGALARDILLKLHFGLPPHRATLDLDLGVFVAIRRSFHVLSPGQGELLAGRDSQSLFLAGFGDYEIDFLAGEIP